MNKKVFDRLIEISKAMKNRRQTGMRFHTTFFLKKGKIICVGWNDYNKLHRSHKFGEYKAHKASFSFKGSYQPSLHSECAAIIKLGETDLSEYEICNVRIDNNLNIALSKPCPNCLTLISSLNPKKIYYSTQDGFEEIG
jgi:deoxycytidylate deaminase